jgi:hypothetical protein
MNSGVMRGAVVSSLLALFFTCSAWANFDGEFDPVLHPDYWDSQAYLGGQEWLGGSPTTGFRLHADYPATVLDPANVGLSFIGNSSGGVSMAMTIRFNWTLDSVDATGDTSLVFSYGGNLLTLVDDLADPLSGSVEVPLAVGDQFGWLLSSPVSKSTINLNVDSFEHSNSVPETMPGWLTWLVLIGICALHWGQLQWSSGRRTAP